MLMRQAKSLKYAGEDEDGGYKHLLSGQQNSSSGCAAAEQHPNLDAHTVAHAAAESLTAKCGNCACCCARYDVVGRFKSFTIVTIVGSVYDVCLGF